MPDGRVQRIDGDLAYIVRRGRILTAPLSTVDSKARVPGARVRFDLIRSGGSESAANVRLRTGTRTSRRQRRFGDLTGAKRPGAKVATAAQQNYGVDVATQPFRVARAWSLALSGYDLDGAVSLYSPEAMIHTPGGSAHGRRHIRAELERAQILGPDAEITDLGGMDQFIHAELSQQSPEASATGATGRAVAMLIDRGSIVEQWIDMDPPLDQGDDDDQPDELVEVVCRGTIAPSTRSDAVDKILKVAEQVSRPLLFARVKLTDAASIDPDHHAQAQATLEFDHATIRAHASGPDFTTAMDRTVDRLTSGVEHRLHRHRDWETARAAEPGSWRHTNLARRETPYFDRPADEREVVRHKSFAPDEMTVDEAAWDMDLLDYDFFLFVDMDSGHDAMLERTNGELMLRQVGAGNKGPSEAKSTTEVEAVSEPVPEMTVSGAIDLLNSSAAPRIFFVNTESGRGNVVYRRYDGHYGLITPPAE